MNGEPGVRTPQQARSRRTRARILEAAVLVFEECGYEESTTAEIARRAQVAVGSVYGYFPDKRAILLEILQETFARSEMEIIDALSPELWLEGDMRQKVRALVDTAIRSRRLRPGIGRIVWERFFRDPLVKDAVEAIERKAVEAIERLLHATAERGITRVRDIPSTAFVIHTSVEWIASRVVLGELPASVRDATIDTTSEMISRLILADPTAR
ncbi:MAG: TetR/AcrR family transcriptional regulator [Myxococcota bacterium]